MEELQKQYAVLCAKLGEINYKIKILQEECENIVKQIKAVDMVAGQQRASVQPENK